MRHITSSQCRVAQVGRAIAWIGNNFRERFQSLPTRLGAVITTASLRCLRSGLLDQPRNRFRVRHHHHMRGALDDHGIP